MVASEGTIEGTSAKSLVDALTNESKRWDPYNFKGYPDFDRKLRLQLRKRDLHTFCKNWAGKPQPTHEFFVNVALADDFGKKTVSITKLEGGVSLAEATIQATKDYDDWMECNEAVYTAAMDLIKLSETLWSIVRQKYEPSADGCGLVSWLADRGDVTKPDRQAQISKDIDAHVIGWTSAADVLELQLTAFGVLWGQKLENQPVRQLVLISHVCTRKVPAGSMIANYLMMQKQVQAIKSVGDRSYDAFVEELIVWYRELNVTQGIDSTLNLMAGGDGGKGGDRGRGGDKKKGDGPHRDSDCQICDTWGCMAKCEPLKCFSFNFAMAIPDDWRAPKRERLYGGRVLFASDKTIKTLKGVKIKSVKKPEYEKVMKSANVKFSCPLVLDRGTPGDACEGGSDSDFDVFVDPSAALTGRALMFLSQSTEPAIEYTPEYAALLESDDEDPPSRFEEVPEIYRDNSYDGNGGTASGSAGESTGVRSPGRESGVSGTMSSHNTDALTEELRLLRLQREGGAVQKTPAPPVASARETKNRLAEMSSHEMEPAPTEAEAEATCVSAELQARLAAIERSVAQGVGMGHAFTAPQPVKHARGGELDGSVAVDARVTEVVQLRGKAKGLRAVVRNLEAQLEMAKGGAKGVAVFKGGAGALHESIYAKVLKRLLWAMSVGGAVATLVRLLRTPTARAIFRRLVPMLATLRRFMSLPLSGGRMELGGRAAVAAAVVTFVAPAANGPTGRLPDSQGGSNQGGDGSIDGSVLLVNQRKAILDTGATDNHTSQLHGELVNTRESYVGGSVATGSGDMKPGFEAGFRRMYVGADSKPFTL